MEERKMHGNTRRSKQWQKVHGGCAKRFVLEDDTPVIAFLKHEDGEARLIFFADVSELDCIELDSQKVGELPDLINFLQPADIIEICCCMDRVSEIC
jgi:hypothetical protein